MPEDNYQRLATRRLVGCMSHALRLLLPLLLLAHADAVTWHLSNGTESCYTTCLKRERDCHQPALNYALTPIPAGCTGFTAGAACGAGTGCRFCALRVILASIDS